MNRRNFMKTVALAVGVSPLAVAGRPETLTQLALDRGGIEVQGRVYMITCDSWGINGTHRPTITKVTPEFLEKFRAAQKKARWKKPLTV